jgi:hypothetical protein
MGAITDIVKQNVPASYRALVGNTIYDYEVSDLQNIAEGTQYRLYATIAGVTQEASVFSRNQIELLGVITTMQFIPAAIDYWGDQLQSQGTSGTNEDVSYFDRRPDLWKVWERLAARAGELAEEEGVNLVRLRAIIPRVSYGDNGRNILVTPDPMQFPLQHADRRLGDAVWTIPWTEPE